MQKKKKNDFLMLLLLLRGEKGEDVPHDMTLHGINKVYLCL